MYKTFILPGATAIAALFFLLWAGGGRVAAQVIDAGAMHSMALCTDSTAMAWGDNLYGQLGDGTNTDKASPVPGTGMSDLKALAGGAMHSLALLNDSTVWAWGYNWYGELGNGTTVNSNTAVQVSPAWSGGITAIAAGDFFSLALKDDGTVWAWGDNLYGQLGTGTTVNSNTAVQVNPSWAGSITDIDGGAVHALGLKDDSTVWGWGRNNYGQLGDGTTTDRNIPVQVSGAAKITAIAGGGWHSLVLQNDSTVWACGYNSYGQLGDGTVNNQSVPVQVSPAWGGGVVAIAGGGTHSLALKNDGTVWGWGRNNYGQLGDGTTTDRNTPVQVSGAANITAIAAGSWHSLALRNDGSLWAWGNNTSGQLGDGTNMARTQPVQVSGLCMVTGIPAEMPVPGRDLELLTIRAGEGLVTVLHSAIDADLHAEIYDMQGRRISAKHVTVTKGSNPLYFNMKNTTRGIYCLRLSGAGQLAVRKFAR